MRAAEALGVRRPRNIRSKLAKLAAFLIALTGLIYPTVASAALSSASAALSDPQPSATANYTFTATGFNTGTAVKCIKELYSVNSDGTGGTPTAMVANTSTIDAASTLITAANFGSNQATSAGTATFDYSTGQTPTSGSKTFVLDGLTNSSATTTSGYWLTFSTFTATGTGDSCGGSVIDTVTVGFFITAGSQLSLTINGTLTFSVNGLTTSDNCYTGQTSTQNTTATTLPFGTVTTASTNVICQRLNAATNATNGYSIYLRYDHKPQNALSQQIGDWTGTNAAPTTPQTATNTGANGQGSYAYTTSDASLGTGTANRFTSGGPKWAAATTANAEVAYEAAGVSSTDYVISHQVIIANTTQPGTYQNTIIYTCTPVY
jgi:hypothetical protein